jgi:hypothetical protein
MHRKITRQSRWNLRRVSDKAIPNQAPETGGRWTAGARRSPTAFVTAAKVPNDRRRGSQFSSCNPILPFRMIANPGCLVRGSERLRDTLTRTCWRLRCCINRIPSDPGADLLSCTVHLIGDSGHNSGRGCRIGFRLLMLSFRPCQTVQS